MNHFDPQKPKCRMCGAAANLRCCVHHQNFCGPCADIHRQKDLCYFAASVPENHPNAAAKSPQMELNF